MPYCFSRSAYCPRGGAENRIATRPGVSLRVQKVRVGDIQAGIGHADERSLAVEPTHGRLGGLDEPPRGVEQRVQRRDDLHRQTGVSVGEREQSRRRAVESCDPRRRRQQPHITRAGSRGQAHQRSYPGAPRSERLLRTRTEQAKQ